MIVMATTENTLLNIPATALTLLRIRKLMISTGIWYTHKKITETIYPGFLNRRTRNMTQRLLKLVNTPAKAL